MVLQVIEYPDSLRFVMYWSQILVAPQIVKKIKVIVIDLVSFKTEVKQDFFSTEFKCCIRMTLHFVNLIVA